MHYDLVPGAGFAALNDAELERRCVLSGSDDYELIFTAPREHRAELGRFSRELALRLRGSADPRRRGRLAVLDAQGKPLAHRGGYDHFAA